MCHQITGHPILDDPEGIDVAFSFDGRQLIGRAGAPIAAALLQNGIRTFRRTEKGDRPRGLFCGIGQCNDCVVVVNGHPNIRACVTPLEACMAIETQRGFGKVGLL